MLTLNKMRKLYILKNKKILFIILIVVTCIICFLRLINTKLGIYERTYLIKFANLQIKPVNHDELFDMDDDLQHLFENIVVLQDAYDNVDTLTKKEQERFIKGYLQNSVFSFDYLEKNCNVELNLTRQQIEYIQWSMTGNYVKFDSIGTGTVNIGETSSGWSTGELKNYSYELKDETVNINGIVTTKTVGYLGEQVYEFDASLEENPYSCFDGYSIKSISIKDVTPVIKPDYKVHEVVGSLIEENITDGKVLIEVHDSKDNLSYDHCITLNLLSNEELQKLVLENKDKELVIRYVLDKEQGACITEITPIDIELKSEKKEGANSNWASIYSEFIKANVTNENSYYFFFGNIEDGIPMLVQGVKEFLHFYTIVDGDVVVLENENGDYWPSGSSRVVDYYFIPDDKIVIGSGGFGPAERWDIVWEYNEKKEIFVQSHVYSYVLYEDLNNNGKLDNGEDANDGGAQTSCAYYDNDKLISETKYNEAEKYLNESALEKGDLGLYNYAEVITYLEELSK